MIKVNLVPVKERKRKQEFLVLVAFISFFLAAILVMGYIYFTRLTIANDLSKQIEEVRKESESYQDKINEVKDLQAKEAALDGLRSSIKVISESQRKVLVGVDQAALNLPEGVWLTNLTEGTGKDANKFTLQGYAFADAPVREYFSRLQKQTGALKEAVFDVKNPAALFGQNKQIKQFEISYRVSD